MKLMTKAQEKKLVQNHKDQDGTKIFEPVIKLFNPTGVGTWWLSELDPETNIAFGFCKLHESEFGYVSIDELKSFKGQFGLGIERDLHFTPKTFDEIRGVL